MFSIKGDIVLDPFVGTGTTTLAAIASERNSIGFEIDDSFKNSIKYKISNSKEPINGYIKQRLDKHLSFVKEREYKGKLIKHKNEILNMPVITSQETELKLNYVKKIDLLNETEFLTEYSPQFPKAEKK